MRALRLVKELKDLGRDPPHGTVVWVDDEANEANLQVKMTGPEKTPYTGGIFRLSVSLPDRYPFEPPAVRFITKVFHPNIDNEGRICLDSLKMPPKGAWNPSMNISQVLQQIRMLLQEPNPDDPLMPEITNLYVSSRSTFDLQAKNWTEQYAVEDNPKQQTLNSNGHHISKKRDAASTSPDLASKENGESASNKRFCMMKKEEKGEAN